MTHPPPDSRSDEELLVAARGDAAAFAALYDRHAAAVAGWLRRRAQPGTAPDLLAETWAQAWISRRRYRPDRGPARAWLYGIAHKLLLQSYRSLGVEDRARRRLGISIEHAATDDAEARVDALARRAELRAGLAGLSPAVRDAVALRVIEGLDYDEIGRRAGCSTQAARTRVSRGLRALRRAPAVTVEPAPIPQIEGALS